MELSSHQLYQLVLRLDLLAPFMQPQAIQVLIPQQGLVLLLDI